MSQKHTAYENSVQQQMSDNLPQRLDEAEAHSQYFQAQSTLKITISSTKCPMI